MFYVSQYPFLPSKNFELLTIQFGLLHFTKRSANLFPESENVFIEVRFDQRFHGFKVDST